MGGHMGELPPIHLLMFLALIVVISIVNVAGYIGDSDIRPRRPSIK